MRKFLALAISLMIVLSGFALAESGEVLTVENCEELAALLECESTSSGLDDVAEKFVSDHAGETVSFRGYIYSTDLDSSDEITILEGDSDSETRTIYSSDLNFRNEIVICAGNSESETQTGPKFVIEDVSPEMFGAENSEYPSFVDSGTNVAIEAVIREYDDSDSTMKIELVSLEERNPLLDGVEIGDYPVLEKGSKGDEVKALQQRLIDLKYLNDKADGSFGGKTQTAVEKFQSAAGIEVTGVADALTQTLLFAENAPEAGLSISKSSIILGSSGTTSWNVNGETFTLNGSQTKTLNTPWGTYKFDAMGNYEKLD